MDIYPPALWQQGQKGTPRLSAHPCSMGRTKIKAPEVWPIWLFWATQVTLFLLIPHVLMLAALPVFVSYCSLKTLANFRLTAWKAQLCHTELEDRTEGTPGSHGCNSVV